MICAKCKKETEKGYKVRKDFFCDSCYEDKIRAEVREMSNTITDDYLPQKWNKTR